MKVLEFKDFSGGLTDKNLPGKHTFYSKADNLLIDHDNSLLSRDGFGINSNTAYQVTAQERVARLINFDFDSELLNLHNKKFEYLNAGVWTELVGPTGNHAFNTNTAASLVEQAQWNHHLFLASDSGDPVLKFFRNGSGTPKLVTAGLPKPAVSLVYPDAATKLAAAIALAVDIKTSLKAHVDDFGVSPAAHLTHDTATSNALTALAAPVTLADIIAYTKVLRSVYNNHVLDAQAQQSSQAYHAQLSDMTGVSGSYIQDPILNITTEATLPADANLDTIEEVIRVLNDVRNKYNWHIVAAITHNNATQTSVGWGAHSVATAAIDINKTTPTISPNIQTFLRYVNYLKAELNAHLNSVGLNLSDKGIFHQVADTDYLVKMSDATDLCTAVGLLGNIYFSYAKHIEKANALLDSSKTASTFRGFYLPTQQITFVFKGDITFGSPNITSVTPNPSTFVLPNGYQLLKATSDVTAPFTGWLSGDKFFPAATKVSSTAASTIVMDHNATFNTGTYEFAFHWNNIHRDADRSAAAITTSGNQSRLFRVLYDPTLTNFTALATLATSMAAQLKAHETSGLTVLDINAYLAGVLFTLPFEFKKNYTYYIDQSASTEYLAPNDSGLYIDRNIFPSLGTLGFEKDGGQGYFEAGLNSASYLYRYTYKYPYTVGAVSFVDESTPSDVMQVSSFTSEADFTSGDTTWRDSISVASIPTLANASNQNRDTSNITLRFYRTIGNGSVYYLDKEITNATSSYSDYLDDTNLLLAESLYTNGGVQGNGEPPIAKYIHVLENIMYYAQGRTVYQSLPDDPDSVPPSFFDTFEEDITGLCSTRANLLVFTSLNVYRVDGQFDTLGQGFMRHEKIFDQTGCVAPQSIVKTEVGVFFFGKDGIYYTDGFQAFRCVENHDTFKTYVVTAGQRSAVQGTYNPTEKKIYWTVKTTNSVSQPDIIVVMDLHFGIKKDATPNTLFSGGFDGYTGFNPTAIAVFKDILYYGDQDGYIFKQTPGVYLDPLKNTGAAATTWNSRTILWDFKTNHEDFGSPNFRKFFARLNVEFEQKTNLSVQIISDADKGRLVTNLPIIRSRKLLDWGDPKIDWTSSVYTAKDGGVIDEFRRFQAHGSLRSNYRAIEMRNAYCVVVASDQMGLMNLASLGSGNYSCTLVNSPTMKWPLYSVGYSILLNGVYYPVTVRTSDSVITIHDVTSTLAAPQTNIKWEMWGYPKNEAVKLNHFDINYEYLGQQQKDYQGSTSTDGGQNT